MADDLKTPVQTSTEHQLDKLPELAPALPWFKEPLIWVLVIFVLSSILIFAVCGYFKLEGVATTFIGTSGTIHTAAATMLGGDKIARKGIYALAANKDVVAK